MVRLENRQYGLMLVAVSAVLWSTAGLFVRIAALDTWTIIAWRSLFSVLTLGSIALVRNRSNLTEAYARLGWPDVVCVMVLVISTVSYVVSLRLTTVANVMTIYAALPFIATAIAFVWLRERVNVRFLIAGLIALAGIIAMAGAAATSRDVMGIAAAFVMTAGFATQLVHVKRHPSLDMMIIGALAAALCGVISVPFMRAGLPSPVQLFACALFGILTTGLAYVLVLKGGRLVSSGGAGFISMLDVVLGPLWVWLFYTERPAPAVLIGGVIVLASVTWYVLTNQPVEPATQKMIAGDHATSR